MITDEPSVGPSEHRLIVPHASYRLMLIVRTIPLNLMAYYMAGHCGSGVDQPRNPEKSVTVE